LEPGGDDGRLGAAEEKPDMVPGTFSPGDVGKLWAICSKPLCFAAMCDGVDAVRGSFCCLLSWPALKDWDLPKAELSQSPLLST